MVERKKGRHLFLPPQKKLDIIVQEINAKKQTKEMASMGDDQEENIEMWKIKKVRRRGLLRGFLFFVGVFFVFLFLFVVGDGVVRRRRRRCVFKSPEMMWSLFVLSLSLSLFLGVRERPNGAFDKTEDDGEVLTRSLFRTPHSTRS